jgi:hypothetical protein
MTLVKTEMVLRIKSRDPEYMEDISATEFIGVTFVNLSAYLPAKDRGSHAHSGVTIAEELWQGLGSPNTITVQIRPGDCLNADAD